MLPPVLQTSFTSPLRLYPADKSFTDVISFLLVSATKVLPGFLDPHTHTHIHIDLKLTLYHTTSTSVMYTFSMVTTTLMLFTLSNLTCHVYSRSLKCVSVMLMCATPPILLHTNNALRCTVHTLTVYVDWNIQLIQSYQQVD